MLMDTVHVIQPALVLASLLCSFFNQPTTQPVEYAATVCSTFMYSFFPILSLGPSPYFHFRCHAKTKSSQCMSHGFAAVQADLLSPERVPPPPLPDGYDKHVCLYGYEITDELFRNYSGGVPGQDRLAIVNNIARDLGFAICLHINFGVTRRPRREGISPHDIVYFSANIPGLSECCVKPETLMELNKRLGTDIEPRWIIIE